MAKSTFGDDVEAFTLRFIDASEDAVRATAFTTFDAIIKDSPVLDGRFKGNWIVTGAIPSVAVTSNTDKKGDSTSAKAKSKVLSMKDWSEFNLTNNLPYANTIEFGLYPNPAKLGTKVSKKGEKPKYEINTINGYSMQARSGVVRVNLARSAKLLNEEFKKRAPK